MSPIGVGVAPSSIAPTGPAPSIASSVVGNRGAPEEGPSGLTPAAEETLAVSSPWARLTGDAINSAIRAATLFDTPAVSVPVGVVCTRVDTCTVGNNELGRTGTGRSASGL